MPNDPVAIADRLRAVAGDDAILDASAARAFAAGGGVPEVVVAPASAQHVAAVLALCSAEGWAVQPAGAGTWLGRAASDAFAGETRPGPPAVVLSTRRLNVIHEYEPADLTIGAGAGTPLAALQARLGEHRQWLALDAPAGAGATIGATVVLGEAGPLRHGFGTPRDAVLGVEVATGDGRLLHFGGRVVKNVAGYDVVRLLVGSRGALGVITRVHLRLRPLADHDITWSLPLPVVEAATVERLARDVAPVALEWVDGALLVRVHGNAATLDWTAGRLDGEPGATRLAADAAAAAWRTLAEREAEAGFVARFHARPAALPRLLDAARALADAVQRAHGRRPVLAAHAADGVVRVIAPSSASAERDGDEWAPLAPALRTAREAAHAAGGGVRYEPLPGGLRAIDAFERPGAELRLMRGIRRHFDPAGILVPGQWLA